jgi:hypothetical protein
MDERRAPSVERILSPVHRWVWRDAHRCARKLLRFAATEADGGRDLSRAAELTADPLLRRLFLRHALDERRHAELFRARGRTMLAALGREGGSFEARWLTPGERGSDDLRVEGEGDAALLAFLHLSEKVAAARFEVFHMHYTRTQLERIAPERHRRHLWLARASRLWKGYLRLAAALAGRLGTIVLLAQYFLILPLFAFAAKRAARRERPGWSAPERRERQAALERQY